MTPVSPVILRAQTTQSPEGETTVYEQLGTYGAWLNPTLGNAPGSNTRLN